MQLKHCFVRVMEEKNKIDKVIEQAIRRVGQERDANDIAVLRLFMHKQEKQKLQPCAREDDLSDYQSLKSSKKYSNRKSIKAIFVSIAAIIAIVFSLNIYQDNRRMDKLFETYYTPLEYDSQLMSRGEETISPELASAMESYQNKDYATALKKFETISNVDENYLIYKAICLLETEQIEDAITLLEKLVANGEGTEYYQQACWYLALTYLHNHQDNNAVKILQGSNNVAKEQLMNAILK